MVTLLDTHDLLSAIEAGQGHQDAYFDERHFRALRTLDRTPFRLLPADRS